MEYLLLPKIRKINPLPLPHFPNRFYAVVFRLWETVDAKQIAKALSVTEEKELALLMYDLMQKSSLIGYEAANHYYFNKGMLAEKVINCEYLCRELNADI